MKIFLLPDLGEGLPDAEISEWHVSVGEYITLDQRLVSMETAKAVVEIPSPFTGKIVKLYGKSGDIIKTGAPLIEFAVEGEEVAFHSDPDAANDLANGAANNPATAAGEIQVGNTVIQEQALPLGSRQQGAGSVKATPAIRALAQQKKLDLATITPTGPGRTITRQDVEQAAALLEQAGSVELLKGTRRAMAQAMMLSQAEVVAVTVVEDAKLIDWPASADITVRIIQAITFACKKEPALNAWFDSKAMGRRLLKEIHLGIAMDAAEGLFVPVIKNLEALTGEQIREQIEVLKKQVNERSISPESLRGATFTLSNFGKFAGRYANPVVVPPMVAILGVGKLREEPVVVGTEIRIGKVLPLALTFDHRSVTGGEATRFLGAVVASLESQQ